MCAIKDKIVLTLVSKLKCPLNGKYKELNDLITFYYVKFKILFKREVGERFIILIFHIRL